MKRRLFNLAAIATLILFVGAAGLFAPFPSPRVILTAVRPVGGGNFTDCYLAPPVESIVVMPQELTPQILAEAVALIVRLRSGELTDPEISEVVLRLNRLLPDPHYFGYTIDHVPELSADDVVRRAFLYRPIEL